MTTFDQEQQRKDKAHVCCQYLFCVCGMWMFVIWRPSHESEDYDRIYCLMVSLSALSGHFDHFIPPTCSWDTHNTDPCTYSYLFL